MKDDDVILSESDKVVMLNYIGRAQVLDVVLRLLSIPQSREVLGDKLLSELRSVSLNYFSSK